MKALLPGIQVEHKELGVLAQELANQTEDAKSRETILDFLQRVH